MPRPVAASVAGDIHGPKPYQQHARAALPILIRQVEHGVGRMTYQELARQLGMPNPRNLDFVLGSIGRTLIALERRWRKSIPPIECIVVNKGSGLPGRGIRQFLTQRPWSSFTRHGRHQLVNRKIERVMNYSQWPAVLNALNLPPAADNLEDAVQRAREFRGRGETEHHRALKEWVARHPERLGLGREMPNGTTEWRLASGDCVDVMFRRGRLWVAVEVKSIRSGPGDLARGLFQCVKYQATLEAEGMVERNRRRVKTILALGGRLPDDTVGVKNLLGLEVIEDLGEP